MCIQGAQVRVRVGSQVFQSYLCFQFIVQICGEYLDFILGEDFRRQLFFLRFQDVLIGVLFKVKIVLFYCFGSYGFGSCLLFFELVFWSIQLGIRFRKWEENSFFFVFLWFKFLDFFQDVLLGILEVIMLVLFVSWMVGWLLEQGFFGMYGLGRLERTVCIRSWLSSRGRDAR